MTVEKAREFAIAAHAGQMYGTRPYYVHLDAVASIAAPYGVTAQVIAYLHDVVEDTDIGIDIVADSFGQHVADCVAIVTDENGVTRVERKEKTHAKMARVQPPIFDALIVKAADRLANMRASETGKRQDLLAIYIAEFSDFKRAVYRTELCDDIWHALDELYQRVL